MANDNVVPLTAEDAGRLAKHRAWLLGHYDTDAEASYAQLGNKLVLIELILENKWVLPSETWKLQSLGVALGDALRQYLSLDWVTFEDDAGSDPALQDPGTSIRLFPLTMISKRVEQGEDVDVRGLFKTAATSVTDLRAKLNGN